MSEKTQTSERAAASFHAMLSGAQFAMEEQALDAFLSSLGEPGAFLFSDDEPEAVSFEKVGATALISLRGPLVNRAGAFERMMGAVSTQDLITQVSAADADPGVSLIVLRVDSPGGMVDGLSAAADAIRSASTPTEAHVEGVCASAAYWLSAAADKITAEPTARIGSIGAISVVRQRDSEGAFTFTSAQSPLKNARLDTSAGRQVYQDVVNDLADVFISSIMADRGVSRETVLNNYGQGAIMVASRAHEAGLIDKITGVSTQMEEQLKAALAINETLKADATDLKAQVVELSLKAEQAEALAAELESSKVEASSLAAKLESVELAQAEQVKAAELAAEQLLEAQAAQHVLSRTAAVSSLLRTGRISADERPGAEMAYDIENAAEGAPKMFSTGYKSRAENSAVNLAEIGTGEDAGDVADETMETQAKALAKKNGTSYALEYQKLISA